MSHAAPLSPSPDPYCTSMSCCPAAGRLLTGEQLAWHADEDSARDRRIGLVLGGVVALAAIGSVVVFAVAVS